MGRGTSRRSNSSCSQVPYIGPAVSITKSWRRRTSVFQLSSRAARALEQYSQKWFRTNYSSARAALLESWKTLVRRRQDFVIETAGPMYGTWLHELFDRREVPLPNYAPSYLEARTAYCRSLWLGPGRGWVDPVKEPQGSVLKMDAGLSTLQQEVAEIEGADWEERLDQREIEVAAFKARGLAVPSWAAMNVPAEQVAEPEEKAQPQ